MIDQIVFAFVGKSISDIGKVDHGIAIVQQWLPVEWQGQVGNRDRDNVPVLKGRRHSGGGKHLVALRSKIPHQMVSNKAIGTGYKHGCLVIHEGPTKFGTPGQPE
jgi:hypothetical protein